TKFISDATAPVLTVTNLSDNGSIRETDRNADGSYTLRGTWSDAGSGTKELQWSVDGETFTTVSESDAPKTTGTANWAVNIPGTSLSETESFAITLKASDNAGNMTERQITGISYDLGAPNIRINKINGTSVSTLEKYYKRDANALSIEILADDSLGVDDIEIVSIKRNDSAAASADYNFSTAADGVNKKGTITIARDGSGDGAWEIKLRAKDKVGRYSQELLISTTVDGTNPSVNIGAATAEGTLVGNDSDTWFKNTTIRVGASASDEGSSKLKEIYYQVVSSSIGSVPEDITGESNAETASVSGSSASFNVTVSDLPGTNASGTNWVLLQAVDNAGNKSGVEKVIINVDTDDPALSALFADEDSDGAGLVEIPGTKYFNSDTQDFTIYGAVSDAGGLASLVFAVDGTPVTPESLKYSTVAPSSAAAITGNISSYTEYSSENKYAIKAWSAKFKLSEFVSGGKLSATATDVSGRKTILTNIIQFTNDSTPPVLVIRTPSDDALITENSLTGDNFVVSGTWSDAGGSGAKQMEWSLDGNSYRNDYVNAPETTASATWQISIPKTELTAGSGKTIYVKAADAAGNWSNPSSVTGITCDYELPELVLESPSSLGSTYARSGSTLDLTFAATDDRGISAIVVDSIKVDDTVVNLSEYAIPPYTITPVDSDGKSVLSIRRDGTLDGKWVIKVRATDSSERDSEPVTVSTIIDATAPTVTMDSSDAWYNNNIVRLNASASDTGGSGLATVYFAVVPSTDSTHRDDIRSEAGVDHVSIAGNSSEFSITVRNLAESTADLTNKILLQAVDGAGNLGTVTAVSGFKVDQTVPNIESKFYTYDGSSTNAHYEAASGTVLSSKSGTLTIYGNIDDKNASLGTNGAVQSGIKNLSFSLVPSGGGNARNLSATVTYSTTEIDTEDDIAPASFVGYSQIGAEAIRSYKAVINASNLDSGNMRAVLTDMAENVTSQSIFTIENDEVKPEINLRTPATVVTWSNSVSQNSTETPAKVNGKITVSGSASDNSALSSVKLYWRTNGIGGVDMNSGWNYVKDFNGNNAYNWSYEFEMTRTDSETGNIYFLDGSPFSGSAKEVEIKVEAEDKASNNANRVFKYVMDPESDRPEIKFNNISLKVGENQNGDAILLSDSTRTWLLSKTIYGVVTDDDGVKEFGYRIGGSGDFTPVTNIQNGSWTINLTGEDGEKDIYFRVVDSEDTEFVSRPFDMGSFSYCSSPVLSDTAGHTLGTYSVLGLKVDTSAPNVGDIKYKILTTDDHAEWSGESTDFTNGSFGGKYKWLKILMTASDPSGIDIDSIEYELNGTAVGVGEHEGNVYCSERIDLSGLATGVYTLKTMVKDGAGAITEKSVTFNVDNTPPVITIEPQGLIKAAVSMYGTVSELGSATYFAVTLPDDTAPDKNVIVGENEAAARKWMEIDGVSLSYNVTFDGNLTTTGATHTDMFRKYIPMLYESVTQDMIDDGSYETVTTLRFHVMSVDRCGNTSFKHYDVSIDPQGTRPEADISYPSKSSTPTLGGTVTLMGIATDTVGVHPGVKDVGVMIDVNEDGRWNYGDISILHTKASYLTFKKYDTDTKQL
ncbi:MAG: hypothetical protein II547_07125, partial [Treponema sp.]|nr:hypothetical protein [Treponema sp.]